jgi:hypothetical protein
MAPEAEAWQHLPGMPGTAHRTRRRPAHYQLAIRFESRPDETALSRLADATVWVNDAHPAYRRALASRSEGYHLAVAVGMALAPLAVVPAEAHAFVTAFLARWGEAAEGRKGRGGRHGAN